jgi:hypothetical protein
MPIPKTGSNAGNGKAKAASSIGTVTPVLTEKDTLDVTIATLAGGKPDKKAYDAQQDAIKKEIDALQVKLVCFIPCSSPPSACTLTDILECCSR